MNRPSSAQDLADLIVASGLLSREIVDAHRREFHCSGGDVSSAAALTDYLAVQGLLTDWQCRKLCQGQYKGFFLDQYRLAEHLGNGSDHARYAADDLQTGQRVLLRVRPGFQYTVEPLDERSG